MGKSNKSKYDLDPQLFKPEPPIDPRHVKDLFCGREPVLERGLGGLKAGLDVDGRRQGKFDKRPWVIHGESRSGKSHLARRIFAELPDNSRGRLQFRIAAGGRMEAINVVRELFEQFRGSFLDLILNQRLTNDPLRRPETQFAKQLVERITLFQPDTQSATLTFEQGEKQSVDGGIEIGGGTLLSKFIAKFQTERSQKAGIQLSLRPPTALDLAEVCAIMAETLWAQKLIHHVLILMDDVDLLEGYVTTERNARAQRSLLADAIRILHGAPGVDVVLTARSWYAHSQKELQTLVDLALEDQMDASALVRLHDLRLRVYAPKHPAARFLTTEALHELAADVDGLPGVFVQHLQTALYQFQKEDGLMPRDYNWLLEVFRRHLGLLQDKCSAGYMAIAEAVREGQYTVDVTDHNPFFGTMLDNEYVYQSYYSETMYFISPFIRKMMTSGLGV